MLKALSIAAAADCALVLAGNALPQNRGGAQPGPALPTQETALFAGSGVCARCHEGPLADGVDVSPVNLWRATMMANSAKDPLWRAKVAAEGVEFPDYKAAIEAKCVKCHAPILYKHLDPVYSTANLDDTADPLRPLYRDGDSCTVCHQEQPSNFGDPTSFSGGFDIQPGRTIFGPYTDQTLFGRPMVNNSGFTPRFAYPASGWRIGDAEHCATCHNLYTNPLTAPSITFPEQMPYYEWLFSDYPAEPTSCQNCHMPAPIPPPGIRIP